MANYPYRMQLVVDPDNPRNVVAAGSVSIYDSEDTAHTTLLPLTDPSGVPIPNPITSNANGFTPPFVTTSPEVLWVSGPYTDYFQSYKGMRDEAVAAKAAAETAAATAGAEAAAVAEAAIAGATDEATAAAASAATAASNASASATAAANAAALVGAPADSAVAALINAPASAARGALNATYALKGEAAGKAFVLAPWKRALLETPSAAKVALVGDSTYDIAAAGSALHAAIKKYIAPGNLLSGMADANILNFGYNGQTTAQITSDAHMADLTAAAPDLIIAGPGINDIRNQALTTAQLRAILVTGFNKLRAAAPGVPIIASMPNSFLTTDVGANGYVVPNGDAQVKSTILREAYLSLVDEWPDVLVHDTQEEVFGKTSLATSPYMGDQIHPNSVGMDAKAAALLKLIGHAAPYSTGRAAAARVASPYSPWTVYGREVEDTARYALVAEATFSNQGAGFVDIAYPAGQRNNIARYDLLELPDGTTFELNSGLTISANGSNTRILVTAVPANTAVNSRGTVKIWRRTTAIETAVNDVLKDTSWRFKKVGRVQGPSAAGANTYIDIEKVSVSANVQTQPAAEWAPAAGDKVYIDGDAANVFTIGTNATAGTNGNNLRLTGLASVDRSALVGRLVVVVGTHA